MENDRSYFMRRAAQERSAATRAPDKRARAAHETLAEQYRERAQAAGPDLETEEALSQLRY